MHGTLLDITIAQKQLPPPPPPHTHTHTHPNCFHSIVYMVYLQVSRTLLLCLLLSTLTLDIKLHFILLCQRKQPLLKSMVFRNIITITKSVTKLWKNKMAWNLGISIDRSVSVHTCVIYLDLDLHYNCTTTSISALLMYYIPKQYDVYIHILS